MVFVQVGTCAKCIDGFSFIIIPLVVLKAAGSILTLGKTGPLPRSIEMFKSMLESPVPLQRQDLVTLPPMLLKRSLRQSPLSQILEA